VKPLAAAALFCCAAGLAAETPRLPVLSLRYEVATGSEEDEDQGELEPTSLRHTVGFKATEEWSDRVATILAARFSRKEYYEQARSYGYLALDPEVRLAIGGEAGLGLSGLLKAVRFDEADSLGESKDYLALGGRLEVDWKVNRRLKLETYLRGEADLQQSEEKSRQAYTLGLALTSKLGAVSLGARYRGTGRGPLGATSAAGVSFYQIGSVNVSWDLNR